jgi:hypothetical protein
MYISIEAKSLIRSEGGFGCPYPLPRSAKTFRAEGVKCFVVSLFLFVI